MDDVARFGSFRVLEQTEDPYPYLLADRCFDPGAVASLLSWFEDGAPWRLIEADFYEQYEFSMFDAVLPEGLRHVVAEEALALRRADMERAFGCRLAARVDFVAHKLLAGQRIAIHNDHLPGHETHRLTVQLNRGLRDRDGGFFMLFHGDRADDVHRVLRPVHGTGIAFEIGPNSHHAVSRLHGGERYTVVYSFHAEQSR